MGKKKVTQPATADGRRSIDNTREQTLETLLQLHWDFADLDRLDDAGPLLHKLMEMAYYADTPLMPRARSRKPEFKATLN